MQSRVKFSLRLAIALAAGGALLTGYHPRVSGQGTFGFIQHNLVSDLPGVALVRDTSLMNPWGLAYSPTGPFWIADNATGVTSVFTGQAKVFPNSSTPLKPAIPPPSGSTATAAPTGVVFNGSPSEFKVSFGGAAAAAVFIFATEDGTISGWSPTVSGNAVLAVDNSSTGAVYKGLALLGTPQGSRLYATDFRNNAIRIFDANFRMIGSFTDTSLPAGFAPFGIQAINGSLYVTFALQKPPENHDDQAGAGNGFVDVFGPDGTLIRQLVAGGTLNSPWGIALAGTFDIFSNALLVGNFGDGTINAFDPATGAFMGQLTDTRGLPIFINGLWSLKFGNGGQGGSPNVLYFTAGLNDEADGLFGDLQPAQSNSGIVNP